MGLVGGGQEELEVAARHGVVLDYFVLLVEEVVDFETDAERPGLGAQGRHPVEREVVGVPGLLVVGGDV